MEHTIPAVIGKLEPRKIYEVTEEELLILENGSDGSIYLNFAIALLTSSLSAFIAFLTVENLSSKAFALIFSVMIFGFILGVLLLIVSSRYKGHNNKILIKIRKRIEEEKLTNRLQI